MRRFRYEPAGDLGLAPRERLKSTRRENGLAESLMHHAAGSALHLFLTGHQHLVVIGRERLPARPPFVLVSNHCSHLDALALAAAMPWWTRDRLFPIAAGDTFFESAAATGMAALLLNALPIWRGRCGRHAIADFRTRLVDEPCGYVLFPEGTRSRDGRMGAFKPGIGMLVAGMNVPVVPCHLRGTFDAWPPDRALPSPGHVQVRVGRAITFGDVPNERTGWEEIARRLEAAVRDLAVTGEITRLDTVPTSRAG